MGADPAQIDLRGRDARVPERVPHDVGRRARPDEVDREGVAQPVRVHPALDSRLPCEPGQEVPDVRQIDRSARQAAEEGLPPPGMPLSADLERCR